MKYLPDGRVDRQHTSFKEVCDELDRLVAARQATTKAQEDEIDRLKDIARKAGRETS